MTTNPAAKLLAIALLVAMGTEGAVAAEAPAAPNTIWTFLAIPKAANHLRDATANRFGKHPGLERTDAIKRLADPANLASDNPAIKAAAEAKADADLAPQKIKAIRYLADIGCACSSRSGDVQNALLAALDDCTEEVRYEAALALCKTAGNACKSCDSTCCGSEAMTKLKDVAFGQDDSGCWKESSHRVRAMAQSAVNACEMNYIPVEEPQPERHEIREERATPEVRTRDIQQPTPAESQAEEPSPIGSAVVPEPAPAEPPAPEAPAETPAEPGQSSTIPSPRPATPPLVLPAGYLWVSDARETATLDDGKLRCPPMPKALGQSRFQGMPVRMR